ncbi:MAG: tRNA (N6-isopentenyl adenosine(37)-C2)-methylthiotransferase MiaB [Planctomycetota bacterium]
MTPGLRYHLVSYGCQMNKLDGELVESRLRQRGLLPASCEEEADVVLLNTCSVRQHAEDRVWSKLGRLRVRKRAEPSLVVGVLGCMAEEHKRYLLARMPHVDLVVGPSAFGDIDERVARAHARNIELAAARDLAQGLRGVVGAGIVAVGAGASGDGIARDVRVRPHRSQAYVSIMRGCNMPCSYCIVPATRGPEVSRPLEDIAEEVERLCADGVSEVTLLGQTVNAYGRDLSPKRTLVDLLERLHRIAPLRRLSFITSHPNFLTGDLIEAFAGMQKLGRYLHLPAQSGSDRVLKAMRRGYTADRYLDRIEALREAAPDVDIHSDFIVGYPGETAGDFDLTVALMERVRFAQSYVFKYSPRPGTRAAELEDDVPMEEKERRNQVLLSVQERHGLGFNQSRIGAVEEVLVEGPSARIPGRWSGRTAHHRIVHFEPRNRGDPTGRYVRVRVREALPHSLVGEEIEEEQREARTHRSAV